MTKNTIKNSFEFDRFTIIGLILIVITLFNLYINYYYYNDIQEIFWYCNTATLIAGFAMVFKNDLFVSSALISAIPSQFLWIADFFMEIFGFGIGRTKELLSMPFLVFWGSTILHGILIPATLYYVYKKGFHKKSFYVPILLVVILLVSTYIFTNIEENRNCVFYPCDMHYLTFLHSTNSLYGTWQYLSYQIIYWSLMISLVYLVFYFYFKWKKKLI